MNLFTFLIGTINTTRTFALITFAVIYFTDLEIYRGILNYLFGEKTENKCMTEDEVKVEKIKYEDKYLVEIRKMDKEFHFDDEEQSRILQKKQDLLNERCGVAITPAEMAAIEDVALQFVVSQKLERIRSCFVMEYTPLGNVLMTYDIERMTFKYYSDNTIPYRYLETVGRKFVKQFSCRHIFVDMEEELRIAEEKWDEEKKKKQREEEEKAVTKLPIETKKPVFAKFKSYNKDAASGKVNMAPPPKNSIPNKKIGGENSQNEKILLKERANRYTYEGKMSNFQFIQKIDRKVTNKKYGTTFGDFKKRFSL